MQRKKVLFIQLPHLDNDVAGAPENVPLAAAYLTWSAHRAGISRKFCFETTDSAFDLLDDHHAVDSILRRSPDVLVATLYVWNVERSLRILREVKKRGNGISIFIGGPEVAPDHPFLFQGDAPFDAAVSGEGEQVFPYLLRHIIGGPRPAFRIVAWRIKDNYVWGTEFLPVISLADLLPPAGFMSCGPDHYGIAYLETSRGCPLHCMFCCYNQRRKGVSYLSAETVEKRVLLLRDQGAREIRLIDPTFNSNPEFNKIMERLCVINRNRKILFFAEVRAETITSQQAHLLKAANFAALEVGVQSRDKRVLAAIKRPTNLGRLGKGIRALSGNRIHLTVDIMNGLPGQTYADVRRSLHWASQITPGRLQFMHTLLLPGTELRDSCRMLGLKAQKLPPYKVLSTSDLTAAEMRKTEMLAYRYTGETPDCVTQSFVGHHMPDLFDEQILVSIEADYVHACLKGRQARKALMIEGCDLFSRRRDILRLINRAVHDEPCALWQFVLVPEHEEPLDLLDDMIAVLRRVPSHFLDRLTVMPREGMLTARRIFVLLKSGRRFNRIWQAHAEDMLRSNFY